ncbi:MAG: hypothetical protein H6664_02145 [Ardenticatenaceae bacterium]|nr:hypothetical protein [Ardenticatenaceae bacterium]MCB9003146.1 hypothetical protein [Ardenticatenaceae bacterium]
MMRQKRFSLIFVLLILMSAMLGSQPAAAQEEGEGIAMSARAGFDGYYKQSAWFPIQVTVANNGPAIEGELRVAIGSSSVGDQVLYTAPVSLPTQSNKRVTLYVDVPIVIGAPRVELRDGNGRLVSEVTANILSQQGENSLLYGVVSSDPGELEFLEDIPGSKTNASVAFLDISELPEAAVAWNSLDVLIFNDVDTGQLSAKQQEALDRWVRTGGQLVVTGGAGWQKTTAAFTDMLPVTLSGSESVADLPEFAAQTGVPFRDPGPYLVATSSLRSGDLLFHEAGLPLLARHSWGRGQVYFLALDPKLAPLVDWDGSEVLWQGVATAVPVYPYWWNGFQNSYSARSAVTSLPSLALPSVLTMAIFLLIYVLVIGPINYRMLKRRGRRELAWVTVPALVLVFSLGAYFTGFQLKGNEVILNQMSVVYGRTGGEPVRVQSLLGLYSPQRDTYDLILPGDAMVRPFDQNFGSMSSSGNIGSISRSSDLVIKDVRVDVSGMETFVAYGYQDGPPIITQASLDVDGSDIMLNITVQNNSDLMLQNAVFLLGHQAVSIGDIAPGASVTTSKALGTSLTTSLTSSAAPVSYLGPGWVGGAPLSTNAETILGTSDYYDDPQVFPRWQMLQAIDNSDYALPSFAVPTNAATLIAWTEEPQTAVRLEEVEYKTMATTLYLLETPLSQNLVQGNDVSLPLPLLQWSVIDQNNVYEASIQNLYLNNGSVDFSYVPWSEFQGMTVTQFEIVMESQQTPPVTLPPSLYVWDWQKETWVQLNGVAWGVMEVEEYGRFLGTNNEVRLRLRTSEYGIGIREVYPLLTGTIR